MPTDSNIRMKNYKGGEEDLRAIFDGASSVESLIFQLVSRGYGWNMTVGALSTGITGGGAGTVIDIDQPEFGVSVGAGFTLIPIRVSVQVHIGLQTTDSHTNEILIAADRAAAYAGDGTVTSETPLNMRSDIASGCPATAFSAATADITDPTLGLELARKESFTDVQGTAATVLATQMDLVYEPKHPPFLVGPAAMYGYWGGDIATVGFAQVNFLVIPSSKITDLTA